MDRPHEPGSDRPDGGRIKALPVLLIVTFRPEFNAPWVGQSHVTSLTLSSICAMRRLNSATTSV